jgi:hypothetical protein
MLQAMMSNMEFGLWIVLGLSSGPRILLAGPEQIHNSKLKHTPIHKQEMLMKLFAIPKVPPIT